MGPGGGYCPRDLCGDGAVSALSVCQQEPGCLKAVTASWVTFGQRGAPKAPVLSSWWK